MVKRITRDLTLIVRCYLILIVTGKDQTIENAYVEFKRWEIDVLCKLTKGFDNKQPVELAHKLFVLLEGMASIAQVSKSPYPVNIVKMADEIIELHLSDSINS